MSNLTNLPQDLLEEILCRIPKTFMRAVRCTCQKLKTLAKNENFTKKHMAAEAAAAKEGEIMAVVMVSHSLHLMSVNLNDSDPSITRRGNLSSLNDSDKLDVTQVYHCEGLLLCTTEDYSKLVLWNPYSGQTRWISVVPGKNYFHTLGYGYEEEEGNSCRRSHKILRFTDVCPAEDSVHEIYNVSSDSWRVLDVTPDWYVDVDKYKNNGVTVKGNTYWYAQDIDMESDSETDGDVPGFLICFDFTTETFSPRLPLPVEGFVDGPVVLSSFREEQQLAVSYQNQYTLEMEVWVTTKIEPNAVSWSKFLSVDMSQPLIKFDCGGSFLVDEEKRAVVLFNLGRATAATGFDSCPITAFFIDCDKGYLRGVDLGYKPVYEYGKVLTQTLSYVPSSLQINQHASA